jgi:hypothetical protein
VSPLQKNVSRQKRSCHHFSLGSKQNPQYIGIFGQITHRPVAFSSETLPSLFRHLFGSHGAFSKRYRLGLHLTVLHIEVLFLPFLCSFKIKTRIASIAAVLKLIVNFSREKYLFERINMCKREKKSCYFVSHLC